MDWQQVEIMTKITGYKTCQTCIYIHETDEAYKKRDLDWEFPEDYECAFEHSQYPDICDEHIESDQF